MTAVLLRAGFLVIALALGLVLMVWVSVAFLPAFVLGGERGLDWVMDQGDRIAGIPLGPFERAFNGT